MGTLLVLVGTNELAFCFLYEEPVSTLCSRHLQRGEQKKPQVNKNPQ